LRIPSGSWRSVVAWALLILIATTVPLRDLAIRASAWWLDDLVHGVLYLVLGWLVGMALGATGRRTVAAGAMALVALALFAMVDELHQRWVPGRVPSVGDWWADVAGATTGLLAAMILWSALQPRRGRSG